jgi:hypothetical protein
MQVECYLVKQVYEVLPPSSAEVQTQSRAIPLFSLRVLVACKKDKTYLKIVLETISV